MRFARLTLLLPALALLCACGVSHKLQRRAEGVIQAQQETATSCEPASGCSPNSPLAALVATAAQASSESAPVHFLTLLEEGEAALAVRVHLMRAARHSIDLQTFIFSEDDVGLLTLNEMLAAARRGVRVRLLLDQPFSLDNVRLLSRLARAHERLELRLFNPTFDKANTAPLEAVASLLCCFRSYNQRMHNKTMVVDGEIGITGGRNIDERYFDLSDAYNYRDRDVLVVGSEAEKMRESFDQYWSSPSVVAMSGLRDVAKRIVADAEAPTPTTAAAFRQEARIKAVGALADDPDYIRRTFVDTAFRVGAVEYFADDPDKDAARNGKGAADLTARIGGLLGAAQQRLVLQTPYLILSKQAQQAMQRQRELNPELRLIVSTNSLAATDAFYVYAISHKYKRRYMRRLGLEIYEYKPFPDDNGVAPSDATLTPDPEDPAPVTEDGAPAVPAAPIASDSPDPVPASVPGDEVAAAEKDGTSSDSAQPEAPAAAALADAPSIADAPATSESPDADAPPPAPESEVPPLAVRLDPDVAASEPEAHAAAPPVDAATSDVPDSDAKRPRVSRRAPVPLLTPGVRRGLHAKSLVVDGRIALIGSHNFDPRSDDYNTEAGLIVSDPVFSQALEALILADTTPRHAWTIARRPKDPVVTPINETIGAVSEELPIFDLWPFRYAISYQLKPGCEPLPPRDPRFLECYEPVGEFPGVNLSLKQIYTRIIMAFGAGLAPIL